MSPLLKGSVTRIADLPDWPFSFEKVDQEVWKSGDYVVAEVLPRKSMAEQFELPSGRTCTPLSSKQGRLRSSLITVASSYRCSRTMWRSQFWPRPTRTRWWESSMRGNGRSIS